ncbi:hypothetical protein ACJX0J_021524, partial [Zea mays]
MCALAFSDMNEFSEKQRGWDLGVQNMIITFRAFGFSFLEELRAYILGSILGRVWTEIAVITSSFFWFDSWICAYAEEYLYKNQELKRQMELMHFARNGACTSLSHGPPLTDYPPHNNT